MEDDILLRTDNLREEVVFLDPSGRVVFAKRGSTDRIEFTEDEFRRLQERTFLLTHNHPSGGSLTPTDISTALLLNVREVNAFGPRYRYRAVRTGEAWPDYSVVMDTIDRAGREVKNELQRRVNAFRLTAAQASAIYWHEVTERFASAVDGVTYVREER
jgi:hypothetical protein